MANTPISQLPRPSYDPTNRLNYPGDGPLRVGGVAITGLPEQETGNLPSTLSPCAEKQQAALAVVRDIWGGTEAVRAKGTIYLPQAPGEDPKNYQSRLARAVFFNAFRSAVEGLTGFVFRKDPVLGEDVPPVIRGDEQGKGGHWENIDNAGTHGDVFIRDLLQDALQAGHSAILVDFPQTDGTQRYDAELRGEVRPYWVPIKKDNILSWRTATINGKTVLTQLVLKECTYVPDGAFGEKERTQYRVLWRNEAGQVGVQVLEVTDKQVVVEVSRGLYPTQTEIPVAEIVTSGRKGMFESDPPLLDLAYLNIAHYQQWSDQATSIHKTCVPVLTLIGAETPEGGSGAVVVGPNSVITLPTGGDAKYTSHDGAALGSVKQALDDLKADMGVLGLSMLAPQKRTAETAEGKRIDKSATDSKLGVTARGLQDGVERALDFHARYLRLDDGGSIAINRDFDDMTMQADKAQAWAVLAEKLNLPVRLVLEALQDGGWIAPSEKLEDIEAAIASQAAAKADQARIDAEEAQRRQMELLAAKGAPGTPAAPSPAPSAAA